ncbi:uncharacterized protein LOC143247186 [Tachypleus tridentatus]|uniref:uncharacterized protein LOC143247186 n=1 Tax=Tachypleus tridentatus TaxID=6853 RepID=UPI003FD60ADD
MSIEKPGRETVTFGLGVYTGIYIAQNYQVPRVDEPKELWKKIKDFAETYKKPPDS